jgi:peptidoglycan/xylan/chitin deacetylase (PgdA/CDA1 family)
MNQPFATVSVDLDPVDLHLKGYGVRGLPPDPLVYRAALPRLLERFEHAGVRATFFVVARDAVAQADALRRVIAAGHEVASHSFTHPLALRHLPPEALEHELGGSKRALDQVLGVSMAGFRAPNFDFDRRLLRAVAAAGYRYDASSYPTPLLLAARLLLAVKSRDPGGVLRLSPWPWSFERRPFRARGAGGIVEFPTSVTPGLRWPLYHTTRLLGGRDAFLRGLDGLARRVEPLAYTLHAVDALGLAEDGVDRRLAVHPGMMLTRREKLAALDEVLEHIAERFEVLTFRERLDRGEAA